jgi:tetratricopeptide (TPR) repeat protein/tRNA A-37 threonylcarbamoyl transferase component Bud32
MRKTLTCSQNHQWEISITEGEDIGLEAMVCPVCGAAAETFADRFLPADGPISATISRWPQIKGYEIVAELGQGGMGVVYKARHQGLKRFVALKMMHSVGTEERARFRTEAEAVARIVHPNIVQVHEVGEQEGLPYCAFELVAGGSLARKLDGTPWTPSQAAELLETLAHAVQAAHEQEVIHRDLKPANVLLATDGTPKVADFGLAKKLDEDGLQTRTNAILGTPSYMAPEQARGLSREIGPAADIYALGAILYELLTGRPPFRGATVLDTLEQVRSALPVPVRQLQPKVPRDLETICLQCLHKEPKKRYRTAVALADDLRRFRAGEPIQARPVGHGERLWRLCCRHPWVASLVAALVLALLGGLAGISWQWQRAQANLAVANRQRDRAEESTRKTRRAIDAMLTAVGGERLAFVPQMEPLRLQLWEQALALNQELLLDNRDDPEARHEVALSKRRVGELTRLLGRYDQSEPAYREAITILRALAIESPQVSEYIEEEAFAANGLGLLFEATGRRAEAETAYREAVELLEPVVRDHPDSSSAPKRLAESLINLANLQSRTAHQSEADKGYRRALGLIQKTASLPTTPEDWPLLALAYDNFGILLIARSRPKEAEDAFRQAILLAKKLVATAPYRRDYQATLASSCANLAILRNNAGQTKEAEEWIQQAIAILEKLVPEFPAFADYKKRLAASYYALGTIRLAGKDISQARSALERSYALWEELIQSFPKQREYQMGLGKTCNVLGALESGRGDLAAAEKHYRQAIQVLETQPSNPADADLEWKTAQSTSLLNLGLLLLQGGRLPEAEAPLRQALPLVRELAQKLPEDPTYRLKLASACDGLGAVIRQPQEAESFQRQALAEYRTLSDKFPTVPGYSYKQAEASHQLGYLLASTHHPPEAEQFFRDSIAILRKLSTDFPTRPDFRNALGKAMTSLVQLQASLGRLQEARKENEEVLAVFEKLVLELPSMAEYKSNAGLACFNLGRLLSDLGDFPKARERLEQGVRHYQAALALDSSNSQCRDRLQLTYQALIQTQLRLSQHREAARTATEELRMSAGKGADSYNAACSLARCVPVVEKDTQLVAEKRTALAQDYATQAIALLREAVAKGFRDGKHMKTDPDLTPLRSRPDFQKIVQDLEAR